MRQATIFALIMALNASASSAQEGVAVPPTEPRCWLGSMTYSPGVTMRASNQRMLCTIEGAWTGTEAWASGCISGGDFYSVGAIENVANSEVQVICDQDGTWVERPRVE